MVEMELDDVGRSTSDARPDLEASLHGSKWNALAAASNHLTPSVPTHAGVKFNDAEEIRQMSDLARVAFWLFLGLVGSVAIVAVCWTRARARQMRHDVVLKLLETGKSLDSETLDRLLAPSTLARTSQRPQSPIDPQAGYRTGNFILFLMGFATLLHALLRHAGLSYPLIALGTLPIAMAFLGWWDGNKQFREGTLPTLKYERDPREAHLNAGFMFFLIGYGTMLIGITHEGGTSYPVVGLGLVPVVMCFALWHLGNREYRAGRLAGSPLERKHG